MGANVEKVVRAVSNRDSDQNRVDERPWSQHISKKKLRKQEKRKGERIGAEKQGRTSLPKKIKDRVLQNRKKGVNKRIEEQKKETQRTNVFLGKARPQAILIKPKEGKIFTEVLKTMKENTSPESCEAKVKTIRKTRNGWILVKLDKKTTNKERFSEALRASRREDATVLNLGKKVTLEIRDMEDVTTQEEVKEAVLKALTDTSNNFKVSVIGPNNRGPKLVVVEMGEGSARKLLKIGKIKIGWINCRIRLRPVVEKCYRCLGFGHIVRNCNNIERKNVCYKCGTEGHISKYCKNSPLMHRHEVGGGPTRPCHGLKQMLCF